jgi:hypothetical protein
MARVTTDEVIRYGKITYQMLKPEEVQDEIDTATAIVDFESPPDDSRRSARAEPLRAKAELLLAVAGCYRKLSPFQWKAFPAKEILSTPGLTSGADFPTAEQAYAAMLKVADAYEEEANKVLARIRPVTSGFEAG